LPAANPGRLLHTAVCRGVHPIELRFHHITSAVISIDVGGPRFEINVTDVEAFAKLDGFANALEVHRDILRRHAILIAFGVEADISQAEFDD
jgi:hypothetical protein